jgi:hypothetical protein
MEVGSLNTVTDPPTELIRVVCQGNLPCDRDELRRDTTPDTGRTVQDTGGGADFADTQSSQNSAIELIHQILSCFYSVRVQDDVGHSLVPCTSFRELTRRQWTA